jgi:adenine C2-methylase RlmN of 23S rRNA A2503 and tRNA A37
MIVMGMGFATIQNVSVRLATKAALVRCNNHAQINAAVMDVVSWMNVNAKKVTPELIVVKKINNC